MPFVLISVLTGYHSRATTCCLQQFTCIYYRCVLLFFFLFFIRTFITFPMQPEQKLPNLNAVNGALIHFTDVCIQKTKSQRKLHEFYCLSVSRKKWSRCVGFVRHFTPKVDQRQMERRRNENEFVVVFI